MKIVMFDMSKNSSFKWE